MLLPKLQVAYACCVHTRMLDAALPDAVHPDWSQATCLHSSLPVVLKVYFLQRVPENVLHMLVRELVIHQAVEHKHVVVLHGAFQVHWARRGGGGWGGGQGGHSGQEVRRFC